MLRKVAATLFLATFAPVAHAQDAMPSLLFDNTLRIQNRFAISEIFVEPDRTWTAVATTADGRTSGTWEFVNGALCVTQTNPPQTTAPPRSFCEPLAGRKVGDVWEKMDPRNGLVRTTLVKGRAARR